MKNILVVDDEKTILYGFKKILSREGYDVITAENYNSALDAVSMNEPDLIFSDIILGKNSGIDLLCEIKKRQLSCPVIMITGEPNIETSAEAVRLGAFDYIPKPIRKDTLLRLAHHGLRHKKLEDKKLRLELENQEVRQNMEAIFSSLKEGIITVDQNMQIVEINLAAQNMCGLEMLNRSENAFEKNAVNCNGACIRLLRETLRTKKVTSECQVECKHPDKPGLMVELTAAPLKYNGEKCGGAVIVIRDITKRLYLERELENRWRFHRIIGKSQKMQEIYGLIKNLSDNSSTALITGETGTGKELVAHAIHHSSLRKGNPFIKVNCSALSENLLESELFGHVKGAFTGAVSNKAGRFEIAHGGTLFLDEIGDISPMTQLKLLRVLQEREFERVGDSTTIKTDVRLLAATNVNLKEKVQKGEFREDLYFRIKVVNLELPPLKDRREDIPLLAEYFFKKFSKQFNKQIQSFSNETMAVFMNYPWPGNVREFEHAIEHGFVLCQGPFLLLEHLPGEIKEYLKTKNMHSTESGTLTKEDILHALQKTRWNKSKAAQVLGIARRTIYRRIAEFGIRNP